MNPDQREVSSSPAVIVPDECPVDIGKSGFDDAYRNGNWDIKIPKPQHFYLNGELPVIKKGFILRKSSSGAGSTLGPRIVVSLRVVRETILQHNITSMIDLACGDVNWIFDSWETDSVPLYLGLDVAHTVISLNQERFRYHSNKIFRRWNGDQHPTL
jgi:hypothetical protein